MNKSDCASSS